MSVNNVCVNASNLRHGGGVQVATSFIDELSRMSFNDLNISVFVSTEVAANLSQIGVDTAVFAEYKVLDSRGLSSMWSRMQRYFYRFDLVFTIFGPVYFLFMPGKWLTGFAQPWIINLDNEIYRSSGFFARVKLCFKFSLQSRFFSRSDKLVVELDHVKEGLLSRKIASPKDVFVVRNCVSSVYFKPEIWRPVKFEKKTKNFSIGFVSRDYLHKNISIILEVKKVLLSSGFDIDFYLTLTENEWAHRTVEFRSLIHNVGMLTVAECPSFYQKMDAVIFPSLLECFSATPLEAMVMEKPLFASDRGFVRDVCGDFAWYFDPLDPVSIASQIIFYIENIAGRDCDRLMLARKYAENFSSARQRAEEYMRIIRTELGLAIR